MNEVSADTLKPNNLMKINLKKNNYFAIKENLTQRQASNLYFYKPDKYLLTHVFSKINISKLKRR